MMPQQSRLVVYLGALGGFLMVPVTDDIELEDRGKCLSSSKQGGTVG